MSAQKKKSLFSEQILSAGHSRVRGHKKSFVSFSCEKLPSMGAPFLQFIRIHWKSDLKPLKPGVFNVVIVASISKVLPDVLNDVARIMKHKSAVKITREGIIVGPAVENDTEQVCPAWSLRCSKAAFTLGDRP